MVSFTEKRLKKLSRISEFALLGTDGFFYVFGEPETVTGCLYADGHLSKKPKKEEVVLTRVNPNDDTDWIVNTKNNIDHLYDKAVRIHGIKYGEPLSSFNLPSSKWIALNERVKNEDASHIQIECNGIEIRVYCFDVRSTIGSSNYKPSWITGANGLYLKAGKIQFKFSIDVAAWKKLPVGDVAVKVFDNGIMRLDYIDEGFRVSIRDQEIRRPHIAFYSKMMEQRVLLLFHPKKGVMVKEGNEETSIE